MLRYLIILFSFLTCLSCDSSNQPSDVHYALRKRNYDHYQDFQQASAHNYTLTIPAFLEKGDDMNKYADLQYQSIINGMFLIAFDETKNGVRHLNRDSLVSDIQYYANYHLRHQTKKEKIIDSISKTLHTINGLQAIIAEYSYLSEDSISCFRVMTFYESEKRFYMVNFWTSNEREGSRSLMLKTLKSFKETK